VSRPRLHFHSDCPFFAGCENMLVNLFADTRLREEYEVSFSFRRGRAYEDGLRARVPAPPELLPLLLIDLYQATGLFDGILPRPLTMLWRVLTRLLLVRYWLVLYNAAILTAALRGRRIDILHVNNGGIPGASSCLAAVLAAPLIGARRVVCVVNNLVAGYDKPDRWLDWPLDRAIARSSTLFVTGSRAAGERLRAVLRLPPERIRAVPNGTAMRPITESAKSVRRRLGVPDDRVLAAVVAVLEERKGHRVLLQALSMMPPGSRPFTAIEGSGPLRAELEDITARLELHKDVVFGGCAKNVFDLMAAADLVVLPSTGGEDFPNVTLEAMSLGRPVIASKVAGVPEQIVEGETGLMVEPGDAEGLARALERVRADAGLRERLGAAGRRRYSEAYTARASADRWLALYLDII